MSEWIVEYNRLRLEIARAESQGNWNDAAALTIRIIQVCEIVEALSYWQRRLTHFRSEAKAAKSPLSRLNFFKQNDDFQDGTL